MTNNELKNKLQEIANSEINSIEKQVAIEALKREDIKMFFSELITYGCSSGIVTSLIHYKNTHDFFDTHYDQIEGLRYEYEDLMGGKIKIIGGLKNTLAWFGFETVASEMTNEFGIEI